MTHSEFMHRALACAKSRRGFCAPNPAVGALVVKEGRIIGEGAHWACGYPHAEAAALEPLGKEAEGAVLYVTLEPCAHHGRTPACTDLIIRSGIREVFFGMRDLNPHVRGFGAAFLEKAGIPCRLLNLPEIHAFYESYAFWLRHHRPFVTVKLATTLDGKIAGPKGQPIAITGEECRQFTHQSRFESDAILTTIATILSDDPQFNVRLGEETHKKPLYILDSQLRLPLNARVFQTTESITVFHADSAPEEKRKNLAALGVSCIAVQSDEQGLNLAEILNRIGKEGRHDLWVEAGGRCLQSFLQQNLAQRAYIYVAPKILGNEATGAFLSPHSFPTAQIAWKILGSDAVARISFQEITIHFPFPCSRMFNEP